MRLQWRHARTLLRLDGIEERAGGGVGPACGGLGPGDPADPLGQQGTRRCRLGLGHRRWSDHQRRRQQFDRNKQCRK
jgi:hypothetical protein